MRHRAHKVGQAIDSDALKFLSPGYAYITESAKRQAIIDAVSAMKDSGLWDYFVAIYPFVSDGVGKTREEQCRFNLKNPDLYKLVNVSSNFPIPSDTGADFGGILNSVQETNIPTPLFQDGFGVSLYYDRKSRTQSGDSFDVWGRSDAISALIRLSYSVNNSAQRFNGISDSNSEVVQVSHTPSTGFLSGTREGATSRQALYRDGVFRGQNASAPSYAGIGETHTIKIGSNPASTSTTAEHRWTSIDYGIPESLQDELHTIVLNYQTALGRA